MPEGKVKITSDDTTIEISGKKVKIKVPGADPDNFPGLPELQDMEDTCSVSQGMLKDALNGKLKFVQFINEFIYRCSSCKHHSSTSSRI